MMADRAVPLLTEEEFTLDAPPDGLPVYRVLTGPDDDEFCKRVSEALSLGYQLYGSPAVTYDGATVVVAQAIVWPAGANGL